MAQYIVYDTVADAVKVTRDTDNVFAVVPVVGFFGTKYVVESRVLQAPNPDEPDVRRIIIPPGAELHVKMANRWLVVTGS